MNIDIRSLSIFAKRLCIFALHKESLASLCLANFFGWVIKGTRVLFARLVFTLAVGIQVSDKPFPSALLTDNYFAFLWRFYLAVESMKMKNNLRRNPFNSLNIWRFFKLIQQIPRKLSNAICYGNKFNRICAPFDNFKYWSILRWKRKLLQRNTAILKNASFKNIFFKEHKSLP